MRHPAPPGSARLRSRPGAPPGQPALPPGVHRLTGPRGETRARDGLVFVPESVAPDTPLLVFFHGAGGMAATSLPLVRAATERYGCLVLLPTSTGPTWDLIIDGWGPDVARVDTGLRVVAEHFEVSRLALGGFSDGASYALSMGLANGDLAQAVLAFSPGFAAPPERVGRPRVWVSHGTEDAVLPIERCARPIVRSLTGAGYQVRYEEFAGPHVVPSDTVEQAVRWWLAEPAFPTIADMP